MFDSTLGNSSSFNVQTTHFLVSSGFLFGLGLSCCCDETVVLDQFLLVDFAIVEEQVLEVSFIVPLLPIAIVGILWTHPHLLLYC